MDLLLFIPWFLKSSWDFFTEITVPGTNITFAALLVGFFLANLGLRFLFMILGTSVHSSDFSLFRKKEDK